MSDVVNFLVDKIDTPIGELVLVADEGGKLRAVDWTDYEIRMLRLLRLHYGKNRFKLEPACNPHGLTDAMGRYFAGDVNGIRDIPVETAGTSFPVFGTNSAESRAGLPSLTASLRNKSHVPKR